MRVLTTWMYFDQSDVKSERPSRRPRGRAEEPDPGIGVAWFGGDTINLGDIDNQKIFHRIRQRHDISLSEALLKECLDLFLMDAEEFEFARPKRSLQNSNIVEYLLSQPIVIERSPPIHVTMSGLMTKTNLPVWIGTYTGWSIAPDHSVLLLITVPGGIIVVSSAIGLAEALAAGLGKSMKRLFGTR